MFDAIKELFSAPTMYIYFMSTYSLIEWNQGRSAENLLASMPLLTIKSILSIIGVNRELKRLNLI